MPALGTLSVGMRTSQYYLSPATQCPSGRVFWSSGAGSGSAGAKVSQIQLCTMCQRGDHVIGLHGVGLARTWRGVCGVDLLYMPRGMPREAEDLHVSAIHVCQPISKHTATCKICTCSIHKLPTCLGRRKSCMFPSIHVCPP